MLKEPFHKRCPDQQGLSRSLPHKAFFGDLLLTPKVLDRPPSDGVSGQGVHGAASEYRGQMFH
ncbi:hypothetical protein [Pseudodesulfovibrio profundus]|uniref:hypothetical protein n=1 Tax=Pseudodesulfovibrio profundus TaxID=57320 RepID=UPI0012FFA887|nr:hypothetical protein [Pseudodesulfovibrio profundus]